MARRSINPTDRCGLNVLNFESGLVLALQSQDEKDEADVLPYPARRFINETKRLLSGSEERFKGRDNPIAQARTNRFHLGRVRTRCDALHGGFLNAEQRINERPAAKADDFVTKMLSAGLGGPKKSIEWVHASELAELS
ncbi:BQ5605_C007g04594 [Microbotryum silenes-dioicae]|uniref:BQ5605_C007g04594 protein n=1 Tax=Microbotryum silenes-dioicae TaxID=796604 RepID=A0A2X0MBL2_9BASI|nr:BQ5605_C007g04594 [Microbotryum silenes-dioicae]